jgi:hypothetical protein
MSNSILSRMFASLKELTLDTFRIRPLHKLIRAFHNDLEGAKNTSEGLQANLATLVAMFPLKRLSLIILMETEGTRRELYRIVTHELDPMDVAFWYAADELTKLGVTFEVFRKAGHYEKSNKLLVEAGWTVPALHSVGG